MTNDEAYAEAHRLEGIMKLAEIDALEATQKAGIVRAKAELSEVYGRPMDTYLLASEADRLDRIARNYEDSAQDAYDAWAAFTTLHNL